MVNTSKCLLHHSCGGSEQCECVFTSLVLGEFGLGSATKSALLCLELCLASGAVHASPVSSLYVECDLELQCADSR